MIVALQAFERLAFLVEKFYFPVCCLPAYRTIDLAVGWASSTRK
ncbi:MAG: hypothetical protein U0X87_06800 [Anaerolineales bacterium]